jgi:hypothetical protein
MDANQLRKSIVDFARGSLAGSTTDLVGAPVDVMNLVVKAILPNIASNKPYGGSAHLRELLGQPAEPSSLMEIVGGLTSPAGAAKAMVVGAAAAGKNIARAEEMLKMKLSPVTVFKETGIFKDQGKYKTVLSDADMKEAVDAYKVRESQVTTLDKLYDHPALYKMYPEIANTVAARNHPYYGSSPKVVQEGRGSNRTTAIVTGSERNDRIVAHEIQHLVQGIEKFKPGGNSQQIAEKLGIPLDEAFKKYLALPGEVEARFTESTKHLTQPQLEDEIIKLLKTNRTPSTANKEFYFWDNLPIRPTKD